MVRAVKVRNQFYLFNTDRIFAVITEVDRVYIYSGSKTNECLVIECDTPKEALDLANYLLKPEGEEFVEVG